MILYEVTLDVEPSVSAEVEEHMRQHHIPAIFATGCFRRIRFQRASNGQFRTSYEAETPSQLERYLRDYAAGFRAEFLTEFPRGVRVSRETWDDVDTWD
ncbi:MAG TPA: DUF4286 family protein [Gemmatimonadales bacterium]|nr:DUF4286 family protein [Gemmatimonadales bacterium]